MKKLSLGIWLISSETELNKIYFFEICFPATSRNVFYVSLLKVTILLSVTVITYLVVVDFTDCIFFLIRTSIMYTPGF